MKLAVLFALFCMTAGQDFFTQHELDGHFEQFKHDFNRVYSSPSEETHRMGVFASNLAYILKHNREAHAGQHTYYLGVNKFADLTNEEYRVRFNGYKGGQSSSQSDLLHTDEQVTTLPDTVDWTTKGVVTGVKDQGDCGSCWAFSAVASIESAHALKTGQLVSLSEQNLIDCSWEQGDMGCLGGQMDLAFQYVITNKGLDTERSYPYSGEYFDACSYTPTDSGATISSYANIKSGSEQALQNAVATVGPISVGIDASAQSFQLYKLGVYNEPSCSSTVLDHGVVVVGYGTVNGVDYWKVKNSWGDYWGEQGYILMSRNRENQCGIATNASYPVV